MRFQHPNPAPPDVFDRIRSHNKWLVPVAIGATILVVIIGVALRNWATANLFRTMPVTVYALENGNQTDTSQTVVAGAQVCLGHQGIPPPSTQCATANDQGLAQIPIGGLQPGDYSVLVVGKGVTQGCWAKTGTMTNTVTVPATGPAAPVTVTAPIFNADTVAPSC